MHRKSILTAVALAIAVAVVTSLAPTTATAQEDDRHREKRIQIRKMHDGDEAVVEREHKVIFVDKDGEVTEPHGEGEGHRWFMGPHGRHRISELGEFGPGGFLGVGTTELTSELRSHFGVPEDHGVMVSKVVEDSGAFRAGILVGDIITAVDGEPIRSGHGLRRAIRRHEDGDAVTLEIWRDGKVQTSDAILTESEPQFAAHHGPFARSIQIDCDDDREDCNIWMAHGLDVCDGDEECEVTVSCEEDVCTCEVNGAATDCDDLEGLHIRRQD